VLAPALEHPPVRGILHRRGVEVRVLRILEYLVIYDSGQVSLEHLLLSRCYHCLEFPFKRVGGEKVSPLRSEAVGDRVGLAKHATS